MTETTGCEHLRLTKIGSAWGPWVCCDCGAELPSLTQLPKEEFDRRVNEFRRAHGFVDDDDA